MQSGRLLEHRGRNQPEDQVSGQYLLGEIHPTANFLMERPWMATEHPSGHPLSVSRGFITMGVPRDRVPRDLPRDHGCPTRSRHEIARSWVSHEIDKIAVLQICPALEFGEGNPGNYADAGTNDIRWFEHPFNLTHHKAGSGYGNALQRRYIACAGWPSRVSMRANLSVVSSWKECMSRRTPDISSSMRANLSAVST